LPALKCGSRFRRDGRIVVMGRCYGRDVEVSASRAGGFTAASGAAVPAVLLQIMM
jgi:hypothetical protein